MIKRKIAKAVFYRMQNYISRILYAYYANRNNHNSNIARIIMYHNISDLPKETAIPYDNVPIELFERQMSLLACENYNVITMSSLINTIRKYGQIPDKTVVVTFDDGYKNNIINALPVLNKYNLKATFFVIAGAIGAAEPFGHILWDEASRKHYAENPDSWLPMSPKELIELAGHGMEIGSHGLSHRSIGNLDPPEIDKELFHSKARLEGILGHPVTSFSYPFGSRAYKDFSEFTSKRVMDAGYESACTTEIGKVDSESNFFQLHRIPIRETDDELQFRQKLVGAYDWVNSFKSIFQKNMARIDRSLEREINS